MKKLLLIVMLGLSACSSKLIKEDTCKDCCIKGGYLFKDTSDRGCVCGPLTLPKDFYIQE